MTTKRAAQMGRQVGPRAVAGTLAGLAVAMSLGAGCKSAEEGRAAADREYEAQMRVKREEIAANTVKPPVPRGVKIPCEQLIDAAAFTRGLNESAPLTVETASQPMADATASCALVRGGVPVSDAEQQRMLKKSGRLGVLPGDDVCVVTAYCWTMQSEQRVKDKCKNSGNEADESLGFFACVNTVASGVYDVKNFRFFDEESKCEIWVRGGGSQVDNAVIGECTKLARETINEESIAVPEGATAEAQAAAAPSGDGGAATGSAPTAPAATAPGSGTAAPTAP